MARQLVRTDVDYAAVGEAGKVQNYEGEALAAIGTIIGEAISNIKINQDKVDGQEELVQNYVQGQSVKKVVVVPGRLVNIVI